MPFDHSNIIITDGDIEYAEEILLKAGCYFDDERRNFIRNLQTIDLQAVPGSGKTTALLAKLLILERKMPFQDGSGILVLSHTNTAVDEIKNRLQSHAPGLFRYPNFVGTIQSFVDEFLAAPFYSVKYGTRPHVIDGDLYLSRCYIPSETVAKWLARRTDTSDVIGRSRILENGSLGYIGEGSFPLTNPSGSSYKDIYGMKLKIRESGILAYDEAYLLGTEYISRHPTILGIIRHRFPIVLIDEMQDMGPHQIDILEKLFFISEDPDSVILQRVGDINQAIYGGEAKSDCLWHLRDAKRLLKIQGSHRLTNETAKLVQGLGIESLQIDGRRTAPVTIKPCLIVFDDRHINQTEGAGDNIILKKFTEIVSATRFDDISESERIFKAVVWSAKPTESGYDIKQCRMKHYYCFFSREDRSPRRNFRFPKDFLKHYDKNDKTFGSLRRNIIGIMLHFLRGQGVLNTDLGGRKSYYNENSLLKKIFEIDSEKYAQFTVYLFKWCAKIKETGDYSVVYAEIKSKLLIYLNLFFDSSRTTWLDDESEELPMGEPSSIHGRPNQYEYNGVKIDVTTVHDVKGETHTATLYLETSLNSNYESSTLGESLYKDTGLSDCFRSSRDEILRIENEIMQLNGDRGTKTRENKIKSLKHGLEVLAQTAKMTYVGFSRPTHLLCYGIHKDRLEAIGKEALQQVWSINEELTNL